ncbi:VOC family protein [Pelomonas sp. P7]|uniref:VOC family protein n=1 Tax=Pelomonas caseinilytica TaxID=2906763 RepID=A0ABS8XKW7_9BURK|nr:VOC family protein [Pelomonas sp. P7]MCE4540217.1 VOC family protein [Pelomonas sp. P7]
MALTQPRYVIAVSDLARSAAWYRDALGFEVYELGDPGWRWLQRDACIIMAGECADALPPSQLGDHGYFAHVQVDDIDALHADVAARGAGRSASRCATSPGACASSASARWTATA